MNHFDFWCLSCPTRVRITTDTEKHDLEFNTQCPACPSTLWSTLELANDGYTRANGDDFFLREHTENEIDELHKQLNDFDAKIDLQRPEAEAEYEQTVAEARRKLEAAKKAPRR